MSLKGKGFYIWKVLNCDYGDPEVIAKRARVANLSHVLIKISDGVKTYNYDFTRNVDLVAPVAAALRANGIQVWGWQYIYGFDPIAEARMAIQRMNELNLHGFVINAEGEFKQSGKATAARKYMQELRAALSHIPIALSSYRFPSIHPQIPWREFLEKCDYNMPQVYWLHAHNPGPQLTRTVREFQALQPYRPVIPTGAAFTEHSWRPTPAEVQTFLNTAQELNLGAANFWEWANARAPSMEPVWVTIRDYPWGAEPLPKDITEEYVIAVNSGQVENILSLYDPNAVHINSDRMVKGNDAIREWYGQIVPSLFPNLKMTLTGYTGKDNSRRFTWTASSSRGNVENGNDTLGILNGKIAYHYTYFSKTGA